MKLRTKIILVVLLICLEFALINSGDVEDEDYNYQDDEAEMVDGSREIDYLNDESYEIISRSKKSIYHVNLQGLYLKLENIREALVKNINLLIKPIVHQIHNGKAKEAAHDFDQMDSEVLLIEIIQAAYSVEYELEEVKIQSNIILFLTHLFKTYHLKIGFDELLRNVESYGETLKSPKLCVLNKRLEGPLIGIDTDTLSASEIFEMSFNIKTSIESSGIQIKCKSKKINDFDHKNSTKEEEEEQEQEEGHNVTTKKPDEVNIKEEINNKYKGDIKNFDKVLKHINTIKDADKAINSTVELLNEMKRQQHLDTNELIQLVSILKTESEKNEKHMNDTSIKDVPSIVHELLWKGNVNATNCWLKNKGFEKYLYVTGTDKNGLRNISVIGGGEMNSFGNWHFESIIVNTSTVFRILNTRFNEYLFSSLLNTNEVFTKKGNCDKDDCYWKVIPAGNATYLQIYNQLNQVLSVNGDHVVIINSGSNNDTTFWDLECKNNKERIQSFYNDSKSNVNQAVIFVESIEDHSEKMEAMKDVLKKMKQNNHTDTSELIRLSHLLKQEMETDSNNHGKETVKELLKEIPEQVQELLWKGNQTNCWLKNRETQEYFYVNENQDEKKHRMVYAKPANQTDTQGNWNFIPKEIGIGLLFQIYSTRFNETLFTLVNEEKRVFTSQFNSTNDDTLWQVIPVDDAKYIQIWSNSMKQVITLEEPPSVEGKRNILLMKLDDLNHEKLHHSHWTLECRNDTERILEIYKNNDNHMENVITFVKSLQTPGDLLKGITTIKDELKRQNKTDDTGLIQLAQFIKDGASNNALMDSLKETFPTTVQELIWNAQQTNCWLNNKAYNEFLYIPEDEEVPRQLFSMVPENMDSFGNWLFLPKGTSSAFHIFNPRLNESIQNSLKQSSKTIHTLKTSECQNNCDWIVVTAYGGEYIQIKSLLNGQFLYVDDQQEDDKRHVYPIDATLLNATDLERTLWTLKCRNDTQRTHELYSANASNVEKALIFIKSIEGHKDLVHNTDQLIKEMIRLQHIDTSAFVQVAFFVKSVVNAERENIDLRSYFSPIIQELIWKGSEINCWIKSKMKDEYFYIADKYNDKGRYVFTWIPGDVGTEGNWLFKPNKLASTFRIRNPLYDEDLQPTEQRSSKEAIRMVTTYVSNSCGNKCDWEIVPAEDATYIQIRNGNHNEYLVADDAYFEGSRSVFTIPLESVNSTNQTFWTITCQTDAERIQSTYNSDLTNFNKSFAYLESIQDKNQTSELISQFLVAMKNSSHLNNIQLLRLANFAKEHMNATGFNETLQKQFPKIIQDIIWMKNDSICWIISETNKLKLHLKWSDLEDNYPVMVSAKEFKDGGMNWRFIPQNKNGGFILQNTRSDKVLYHSNLKDAEPGVFTKKMEFCRDECQWKTVPAADAQFIQIMSALNDEILIIGNVTSKEANLTTIEKESIEKEQLINTFWSLDCKNDKDRIISLYDGQKGEFNLTLSYIKSLGKPNDIVKGTELLVKLMEEYDHSNSNEMLQLAFYAKDLEINNTDKEIKNRFPVMVQNLVWADPHLTCWLKNEITSSYLSSDIIINTKNQRLAFSVTSDEVSGSSSWLLKPQNGGESYRIYNSGTKEHLQSTVEGTDHLLFTYNNDSCEQECYWKIIPIDDQHIQISFFKTGEILLAGPLIDIRSSNKGSNLNLVTESNVNSEYDNTLWILDCKENVNRIPLLYEGTLNNFNKSMKFIKSLHEKNETRNATLSLLNEMKENKHQNTNEFVQLVFFIKNQLNMSVNDESIHNAIPSIVKALIWKEENLTCWIQNELHDQYLLAYDKPNSTKVRQVIMSDLDKITSSASWDIKLENEGNVVQLRNIHYLQDMYANKEDKEIPYTINAKSCMNDCSWQLIPSSNGDSMQIRHKYLKKYLSVNNQKPILTSLDTLQPDNNATLWKFKCLNDKDRIHLIYNNSITRFNQTLNYIKSMNKLNSTILATHALLYEMNVNKHIDSKELVQLAYFTKQAIDLNGTTSLKSQFPSIIQDLIWKCNSDPCSLKSEYSNEYLYSAYGKSDQSRRHIHTWIPGNKDSQSHYNFEPKENASIFAIKSMHFDEYVYSYDGRTGDEDRRPIFSWIPGDWIPDQQGLWEIYTVNNGTCIQVRNNHTKEFMIADEPQDEERRTVVTWAGDPLSLNRSRTIWTLDTN